MRTLEEFRAAGVRTLEEPPEGWHRKEGCTTAPNGWEWWGHGSHFDHTYEHALVRTGGGRDGR